MKRELWIPVAVAGLCLVFAAICLGLSLWRKNGWLLKKKLRVGAMLLSLTGFAAGGGPVACCYASAGESPLVSLDGVPWGGEVTCDVNSGRSLEGEIDYCSSDRWSFRVTSPDGRTEVQRGSLIPLDGAFDQSQEAFRLNLAPSVELGDYQLCVHALAAEDLEANVGVAACFDLTVIDSSLDGE